jgi:hypothetical protein
MVLAEQGECTSWFPDSIWTTGSTGTNKPSRSRQSFVDSLEVLSRELAEIRRICLSRLLPKLAGGFEIFLLLGSGQLSPRFTACLEGLGEAGLALCTRWVGLVLEGLQVLPDKRIVGTQNPPGPVLGRDRETEF